MNRIVKDEYYKIDYVVFPVVIAESVIIEGESYPHKSTTVYRIFSRDYSVHWRGAQGWQEAFPCHSKDWQSDRLPVFETMEEAYDYLEKNINDIA